MTNGSQIRPIEDSMSDAADVQAVVDAAERAATAGDYASAERLLREAAQLQETNLGSFHPDLANTLNNLGIVCERLGDEEDAERCYRRACAIAASALAPDHPFVATSRQNLEDFCRARGKPLELSGAQPPHSAGREMTDTAARPEKLAIDEFTGVAADSPRREWYRPVGIAVLFAGGLLVSYLVVGAMLRSRDADVPAAGAPAQTPERPSASTPGDKAVIPQAPAATDASRRGRAAAAPTSVSKSRPTTARGPAAVVVVEAKLCRRLSTESAANWNCVGPADPIGAGPIYFYTRVRSPSDTTVQHRWYRGAQLRQAVDLRVRANPSDGYRTYSRTTISALDGSEWRVELRTTDGVLLHEARFTAR
jgi:hypothetical protein